MTPLTDKDKNTCYSVAERRIMHSQERPFGNLTLAQMEAADTDNMLQQMKDAGYTVESRGNGGISITGNHKEGGTDKDWNTGEKTYVGFTMKFGDGPETWDNHVTLAVRVHDPATDTSNFMVIDPHLQKEPKLLSFAEWKQMQNCDPAVVVLAQVGQKAELVTEPGVLRPQEEQKLSRLLDAAGAEPGAPADRLNSLEAVVQSDEYGRVSISDPYDGIMRAMKNMPGTANDGERIVIPFVAEKFPGVTEEAKSTPKDPKAISGDWDTADAPKQHELAQRWTNDHKPLRLFQDACGALAEKMKPVQEVKAAPTAPKQQSRSSFSSAP